MGGGDQGLRPIIFRKCALLELKLKAQLEELARKHIHVKPCFSIFLIPAAVFIVKKKKI